MPNSEKIVAAAVRTVTGNVYTGLRHPTIRADIFEAKDKLSESCDGFLTSEGRFVTREEAARIAYSADQRHLHSGEMVNPSWPLVSEDLW